MQAEPSRPQLVLPPDGKLVPRATRLAHNRSCSRNRLEAPDGEFPSVEEYHKPPSSELAWQSNAMGGVAAVNVEEEEAQAVQQVPGDPSRLSLLKETRPLLPLRALFSPAPKARSSERSSSHSRPSLLSRLVDPKGSNPSSPAGSSSGPLPSRPSQVDLSTSTPPDSPKTTLPLRPSALRKLGVIKPLLSLSNRRKKTTSQSSLHLDLSTFALTEQATPSSSAPSEQNSPASKASSAPTAVSPSSERSPSSPRSSRPPLARTVSDKLYRIKSNFSSTSRSSSKPASPLVAPQSPRSLICPWEFQVPHGRIDDTVSEDDQTRLGVFATTPRRLAMSAADSEPMEFPFPFQAGALESSVFLPTSSSDSLRSVEADPHKVFPSLPLSTRIAASSGHSGQAPHPRFPVHHHVRGQRYRAPPHAFLSSPHDDLSTASTGSPFSLHPAAVHPPPAFHPHAYHLHHYRPPPRPHPHPYLHPAPPPSTGSSRFGFDPSFEDLPARLPPASPPAVAPTLPRSEDTSPWPPPHLSSHFSDWTPTPSGSLTGSLSSQLLGFDSAQPSSSDAEPSAHHHHRHPGAHRYHPLLTRQARREVLLSRKRSAPGLLDFASVEAQSSQTYLHSPDEWQWRLDAHGPAAGEAVDRGWNDDILDIAWVGKGGNKKEKRASPTENVGVQAAPATNVAVQSTATSTGSPPALRAALAPETNSTMADTSLSIPVTGSTTASSETDNPSTASGSTPQTRQTARNSPCLGSPSAEYLVQSTPRATCLPLPPLGALEPVAGQDWDGGQHVREAQRKAATAAQQQPVRLAPAHHFTRYPAAYDTDDLSERDFSARTSIVDLSGLAMVGVDE
ncbi:hypothetical protein JCM10207_006152 [Rhodosporidiobolus poonsookiae]